MIVASDNHKRINTTKKPALIDLPVNRKAMQFCWHIRVGLFREIELNRIQSYATYFYHHYLLPYFSAEEKLIVASEGINELVIRKIFSNQRRLKRLFEERLEVQRTLRLIEDRLEEHTRYENLVLFRQIVECGVEKDGRKTLQLFLQEEKELGAKMVVWNDRYWELE